VVGRRYVEELPIHSLYISVILVFGQWSCKNSIKKTYFVNEAGEIAPFYQQKKGRVVLEEY
jgi:hypothetical protein